MKRFFNLFFIFLSVLLSSCAASYKPMDASRQSFINTQTIKDSLRIGYKYNLYSEYGNKKYSKKEGVHGYKLIAIEINNLSNAPIQITKDNLKLFIGDNEAHIINIDTYLANVRQEPAVFLLHGLWGPWIIKKTVVNGVSNTKVQFIPIGLGIGIINTAIAAGANKKHITNIKESNIWGKSITPNGKIAGFICIKNRSYDQINFKYID